MNTKKFDKIFANLRKNLIKIRNSIFENKKPVNELSFNFDKNLQLELAKVLANIFGYDFNIGRMDLSQHPFSTGNGNDVRITTRVDEKDPFNCFYSTIHETGHAVYEQKIPKEFIFTPNGNGVSMGVHESQSRIFENQFGRSKEFCSFLFKLMYDKFGNFGINDENNFYFFINNVENSFIRTEADEVNYNLHILMRYDLEKELFSGNLKGDDLEEAWNNRFKNDFGLTVSTPTEGFLQDVHWSAGLFGYFPTYTLGNIYAGCLYEKILIEKKDIISSINEFMIDQKNNVEKKVEYIIKTPKKSLIPRSERQKDYVRALRESDIIISAGPAGTGKTFLAVAVALTMLLDKKIERIILSRPAVEAGERLGFLPGDMRDKVDPYLRPLYDSLYDLLDFEKIQKKIEVGDIEIAPLAFMRGRTLKNSFAILDEAQNATDTQIKMFLTRIGENSKIVINGDPSQIDLPNKSLSGLYRSKKLLGHLKEISVVDFNHKDVVRHPLVSKIVKAYSDQSSDG